VGVYCLSLSKQWDWGFESHFGNGCTSGSFSEFGFCPAPQGDLPESTDTVASWLGWLVASLLQRRLGFDSRPAMLDVFEVTTLRYAFLRELRACFTPFKILTG
jgi:hypothetical protein